MDKDGDRQGEGSFRDSAGNKLQARWEADELEDN